MAKSYPGGRGSDIMPMPRPGNRFSEVPKADIPRSAIDRSHQHKTTFDAGYLIPFYVDEVLPGDTFNCKVTAFARLSTPIYPVMDNIHLETFFFFVPNRLLWTNWERFNGAQIDPGDSIDFTIPRVLPATADPIAESFADYMGIPLGLDFATHDVNVLPFRAYRIIWNEWFRDQNLQDSESVGLGDGDSGIGALLRRGKRHDYFTSSLPWPQKGNTGVQLPLGDRAEIVGLGFDENATYPNTNVSVIEGAGNNELYDDAYRVGTTAGTALWVRESTTSAGEPDVYVDLQTATAASINQIRQAFQIQKLLERDARGGTRYTEIVKSHFGVTSPDARLQRPEYLGGGSAYVNISPIAQTAEGTGNVGDLAAMGTASFRPHGFTQSFTEHGYILGLVSARADLTYQQGLSRMWSRQTRYDFYWPAFAHIGEQAVLNKEIFVDNTTADEDVWGYQERYAEYRYAPSRVSGKFRSDATGTLDAWHLALDFTTRPALNATFIEDNPPIDRVVAVPSEPHFIFDSLIQLRTARPMPVYGVPGMVDHF